MSELIWLHPDCLSTANPAFEKYPGAQALFVFDEAEIEAECWSLKRIAFLYETLLEMPTKIERGDPVERILALKPAKVVTVASLNPRFEEQRRRLAALVPVEVLAAVPFFDYAGKIDLKRFSRYWQRVEAMLF